jgi:hypothetical protein
MQESSVTFFFEGVTHIELVRSQVSLVGSRDPIVCVRGKTSGAFSECGCFQWTSGVRGVCATFLRFVLSERDKGIDCCLAGGRSSLAASLDYALSKGPSWLLEMFGRGRSGTLYARRFFRITNPNRKRPGPVVVSINGSAIKSNQVRFVHEGREVVEDKQLYALLLAIEEQEVKNSDRPATFPALVAEGPTPKD